MYFLMSIFQVHFETQCLMDIRGHEYHLRRSSLTSPTILSHTSHRFAYFIIWPDLIWTFPPASSPDICYAYLIRSMRCCHWICFFWIFVRCTPLSWSKTCYSGLMGWKTKSYSSTPSHGSHLTTAFKWDMNTKEYMS